MQPSFANVRIECDDAVARVVLSRPPVNAIDLAMFGEIEAAFDWVGAQPELAVAVLHSDVKHFCAGSDLHDFKAMTQESAETRNAAVRAAFWAVLDCPVPVIGAVHGVCVGSGVALAAVCDFVLASSDAEFGVPELSVGVLGGARHLRRLVPEPVMRKLYYTGGRVGPDVLAAHGGVAEVVPRTELVGRAVELAAEIAERTAPILRVAKTTLNEVEDLTLKEGYAREQAGTARLAADRQARANLDQVMAELRRPR